MQIRNKEFHPVRRFHKTYSVLSNILQYLSLLLLGQLYVIDLALRIVRQRNDNIRDHLIKLRGSHEHTLTYQIQAASAKRKVTITMNVFFLLNYLLRGLTSAMHSNCQMLVPEVWLGTKSNSKMQWLLWIM